MLSASGRTPCQASAEPGPVVPEDGQALFDFLLSEIPDLAYQVPCSCCPFTIGQCYEGACPTTCGPCNRIGRDVYRWRQQGLADEVIVGRVEAKYPRRF